MTRQGGDYLIVWCGENIDVPTIDLVPTEVNIIGNLDNGRVRGRAILIP